MHVIVLDYHPSTFSGGIGLCVLDICRGLNQRGHEISLLYMQEGNLINSYREFGTRLLKVNNFTLDRNTITQTFNFLFDIWQTPSGKNSVVYSHRYHDIFFGYALSKWRNIPAVCHLHLPALENFGRPQRLGLNAIKQFIAVSQQTKLTWVNQGFAAEKINVVHNGIDSELYKPITNSSVIRKEWNIPENTLVISYVGRIDREKGIETLIKAFALLPQPKKLMIAGSPVSHSSLSAGEVYKQSLAQLATDLGIEKYVDFLGPVANTTAVYQVSNLTVLPSLWSEPFGRTIVESMACGTPVVASRIGGIPEIITGEFKIGLFEPGNQQDLANAIARVLAKPQLVQQCRQHVLANFSLEQMVDGVEKSLLQVVR